MPLGTTGRAFLSRISSKFQQIPFHTGESQHPGLVWVEKTLNLIAVGWNTSHSPGWKDTGNESQAEPAWKSFFFFFFFQEQPVG